MADTNTGTPKAKRRKMFYYQIINSRTIFVPDIPVPKVNADAFSEVSSEHIDSFAALERAICCCYPLSRHFGKLANDEAENLQQQLDSDPCLTAKQKTAMRELISKLESDPEDEEGWRAWIEAADTQRLPEFAALVDAWLASEIDWDESDYFDDYLDGQEIAKRIFEAEDQDVLDALQIEIIEGECPGSSYFAAELGLDIESANKVARRLKLDYRFKA